MNPETIFEMKKELIKRDPLYDALSKTFHKIIDARAIDKKDNIAVIRIGDQVLEDVKRYYATSYCPDSVREEHKQKHPDQWKLFRLGGELCFKWGGLNSL